ncbi:MAG: hypothetical protein AB7V39_28555 [Nitrospiraceae bacterium]
MLNADGPLHGPDNSYNHRIDLADHGRRDTNCVEILQWSGWPYRVSSRYVTLANNGWRISDNVRTNQRFDLRIIHQNCELREALSFTGRCLARPFRDLDEAGLRCTAVDLVMFRDVAPIRIGVRKSCRR